MLSQKSHTINSIINDQIIYNLQIDLNIIDGS